MFCCSYYNYIYLVRFVHIRLSQIQTAGKEKHNINRNVTQQEGRKREEKEEKKNNNNKSISSISNPNPIQRIRIGNLLILFASFDVSFVYLFVDKIRFFRTSSNRHVECSASCLGRFRVAPSCQWIPEGPWCWSTYHRPSPQRYASWQRWDPWYP